MPATRPAYRIEGVFSGGNAHKHMNITPKVIGYAIHRILASQQITPGCSIPLKTLMELWPSSLLRRKDLGHGVQVLLQDGCIAIEQAPEGPVLRLINESFSLVNGAKDRDALDVLKRVRDLRHRPASFVSALMPASVAPLGRRRADRSPPNSLRA